MCPQSLCQSWLCEFSCINQQLDSRSWLRLSIPYNYRMKFSHASRNSAAARRQPLQTASSPEPPITAPPEDLLQPLPSAIVPGQEALSWQRDSSITVKRFEVVGHSIQGPVGSGTCSLHPEAHLAELFQARSAVTKLYIDQGYVLLEPISRLKGNQEALSQSRWLSGLEAINVTVPGDSNQIVCSSIALNIAALNRNRLLESCNSIL